MLAAQKDAGQIDQSKDFKILFAQGVALIALTSRDSWNGKWLA